MAGIAVDPRSLTGDPRSLTGARSSSHGCSIPDASPEDSKILSTLTRAALGMRAAHASADQYVRHLARLNMEGVDVGMKYHTRGHFQEVQFLAAQVTRVHDAADLQDPLSGLGIRSDFAILMDGIPVGGLRTGGRHGSILVLCFSAVSSHTSRLHARLGTWCESHRGHGGVEVAADVLATLRKTPLNLDLAALRASLSLIGGDGAVVAGGPERGNPGTQTAEIMWTTVHPHIEPPDERALIELGLPPRTRLRAKSGDERRLHLCTEWDKFHRQDLAWSRAIRKSHAAEELYEVCAVMEHMFHFGDGRRLLQTAAEASGVQHKGGWMPSLTRKVGAIGFCFAQPSPAARRAAAQASAAVRRAGVGWSMRMPNARRRPASRASPRTCWRILLLMLPGCTGRWHGREKATAGTPCQ